MFIVMQINQKRKDMLLTQLLNIDLKQIKNPTLPHFEGAFLHLLNEAKEQELHKLPYFEEMLFQINLEFLSLDSKITNKKFETPLSFFYALNEEKIKEVIKNMYYHLSEIYLSLLKEEEKNHFKTKKSNTKIKRKNQTKKYVKLFIMRSWRDLKRFVKPPLL